VGLQRVIGVGKIWQCEGHLIGSLFSGLPETRNLALSAAPALLDGGVEAIMER